MKKTLLTLSALGVAVGTASAAVISVNFEGLESNAASANLLATGDVAGVVPVANWNNIVGAAGTGAALVDDSGAASGATLDWTGQATWSWERSGDPVPANPNGTMFNGYLDTTGNDGSHTMTINGIPFAAYSIYVYVDGEHNVDPGRPGRINAGGADTWISDSFNWDGTFVQGTGTDLASATERANYVLFDGLSGSSATIFGEAETFRFGINGLQIVEVPEPASMSFLALGLAMIFRRRR